MISVCIPAYNRAEVLSELLDSIVEQDGADFEIVVAEDGSPDRLKISQVVALYQTRLPRLIRYYENESTLGFDGNIRRLLELARGEYCLFMGNDDLMSPGALATVASALRRYPNVGAILRSYAAFQGTPDRIVQEFRYFPEERFFPAGADTIATFFRRMVVLPGIVIHREAALLCATDRFDGTLLYQLYVIGNVLAGKNGVFLPQFLALYRMGGLPDFGNSPVERGKFVPGDQTPESSLNFMRGMLQVAKGVEESTNLPVYKPIHRDLGNYSYGFLAIQRRRPLCVFLAYCRGLARLGFGKYALFYAYTIGLLLLGDHRTNVIIAGIKSRLGHTPLLGRVYDGQRE
jgi:hypothetical protein